MREQNDKTPLSLKAERNKLVSALALDRDKNLFYLASDESIDEVLDEEGYHVVHANRKLSIEDYKK
jgi:hypothetical protein